MSEPTIEQLEERLAKSEAALEKILAVCYIQGFLPRPMPVVEVPERPKTIARNVDWCPVPGSTNNSALFTYDCSGCGRAHRLDQLIPSSAPRRGQYFPARCKAGYVTDVLIERES
jgi:hypothetical protein